MTDEGSFLAAPSDGALTTESDAIAGFGGFAAGTKSGTLASSESWGAPHPQSLH